MSIFLTVTVEFIMRNRNPQDDYSLPTVTRSLTNKAAPEQEVEVAVTQESHTTKDLLQAAI